MPEFAMNGALVKVHLAVAMTTLGFARNRNRPEEPVKILFMAKVCRVGRNSSAMGSPHFIFCIISYSVKKAICLHFPEEYGRVSGGDVISMSTKERINEFLRAHGSKAVLENGYGLTEASGGFIFSPRSVAEDPDAIGFPIPDNEVVIMDLKTKKPAPTGKDGEIVVRGLSVMKGYLDNPKATEEAFIKIGTKKYLRTGDIGYVDENGLFHFRARLKRMIVSNGYNIYPATIEEATLKCQDISACAVVGREDKLRGEKVVVFVVAKPDTHERAIRKELGNIYRKYLAKYETPREIRFIDELPKTKLAKVDFKALEQL